MNNPPTDRIENRRRWPARIIALFLLLEGTLLLGAAVHEGLQTDWQRELIEKALSRQTIYLMTTTGFLVPLAALSLLAAAGFAFIRPGGWLLAMIVQGLILLSGLILHYREGPDHVYILMAYAVFMTFYINSSPVRVLFHRNNRRTNGDDAGV